MALGSGFVGAEILHRDDRTIGGLRELSFETAPDPGALR